MKCEENLTHILSFNVFILGPLEWIALSEWTGTLQGAASRLHVDSVALAIKRSSRDDVLPEERYSLMQMNGKMCSRENIFASYSYNVKWRS